MRRLLLLPLLALPCLGSLLLHRDPHRCPPPPPTAAATAVPLQQRCRRMQQPTAAHPRGANRLLRPPSPRTRHGGHVDAHAGHPDSLNRQAVQLSAGQLHHQLDGAAGGGRGGHAYRLECGGPARPARGSARRVGQQRKRGVAGSAAAPQPPPQPPAHTMRMPRPKRTIEIVRSCGEGRVGWGEPWVSSPARRRRRRRKGAGRRREAAGAAHQGDDPRHDDVDAEGIPVHPLGVQVVLEPARGWGEQEPASEGRRHARTSQPACRRPAPDARPAAPQPRPAR